MKVAVFGAAGQLGTALKSVMEGMQRYDVCAFSREDVDVTDRTAVEAAVDACRPDVVINAAALTDVDGCERDEARAYQVNALAARWLAASSERHGALMIQVSTDYVFRGDKGEPYHEWDEVGPLQAYGRSKLAGELEVHTHCPRHLIVRTSWLYGGPDKGFVRAILRMAKEGMPLSVVVDQAGNPSFTEDVAKGIVSVMESGVTGTVHVSNAGRASRYELAQEIVRQIGSEARVDPLESPPATAVAARPADTSVKSLVLETAGIRMPSWQEGLHSFLSREV